LGFPNPTFQLGLNNTVSKRDTRKIFLAAHINKKVEEIFAKTELEDFIKQQSSDSKSKFDGASSSSSSSSCSIPIKMENKENQPGIEQLIEWKNAVSDYSCFKKVENDCIGKTSLEKMNILRIANEICIDDYKNRLNTTNNAKSNMIRKNNALSNIHIQVEKTVNEISELEKQLEEKRKLLINQQEEEK
jgi:hypothetical protein